MYRLTGVVMIEMNMNPTLMARFHLWLGKSGIDPIFFVADADGYKGVFHEEHARMLATFKEEKK